MRAYKTGKWIAISLFVIVFVVTYAVLWNLT
jgi:hypothetical protein